MAANIILLFILLTFSLIGSGFSYKILLIMPAGTRSHTHFYGGVIQALAEQGHKVTMITPFKYSSPRNNIRVIQLSKNFIDQYMSNAFETNNYNITKGFAATAPKGCIETFLEDNVQAVLKEEFDLFLQPFSFADCYFSVIYQKNIPFVFVFPNIIVGPFSEIVGNIDFHSFVPNMFLEATHPKTFIQRMQASLFSVMSYAYTRYLITSNMEKECRSSGVCPNEMPSFEEMQKRASLAIINSVRPLEQPARPYSPNVILAGGIHINKPGIIPRELSDWIEESGEDGFIFFSLGSAVKTTYMEENVRRKLLNVLGSLKQRVLWKWDSPEMEDLPHNVKISSWLPQQDILAHPKIRLFISHGGLLSIQEATYFGVPLIGMPVFVDQRSNIAQIVAEGWGRKADLNSISEEELHRTITEVLRNSSLRAIVEHRAKLMKDLPRSPAEEVVYWIEYVLRHNGAKHLQSPLAHMPWHEIYNIDVWAFIFSVITSIVVLTICVITFCIQKCWGKKLKTKKE